MKDQTDVSKKLYSAPCTAEPNKRHPILYLLHPASHIFLMTVLRCFCPLTELTEASRPMVMLGVGTLAASQLGDLSTGTKPDVRMHRSSVSGSH